MKEGNLPLKGKYRKGKAANKNTALQRCFFNGAVD
jgi:hypothetical protein